MVDSSGKACKCESTRKYFKEYDACYNEKTLNDFLDGLALIKLSEAQSKLDN